MTSKVRYGGRHRDRNMKKPPKMHKQTIDLSGQTFGQLLVLAYAGVRKRNTYWRCKCLACGSVRDYKASNLRAGNSTACHHCPAKRKGGKWGRPIYTRWLKIINTGEVCKRWQSFEKFAADVGAPPKDKKFLVRIDPTKPYKPSNCVWTNNGTFVLAQSTRVLAIVAWKRVIKSGHMCQRWLSFEAFMADMGEPPKHKPYLKQIDLTKQFEPGNCLWATSHRSRLLTHNGRTMSMSDWARELGISKQAVFLRLKKMSVHEALTKPRQSFQRVVDLTGQTFGQLLVLADVGSRKKNKYWRCKCLACGSVKDYQGTRLRSGQLTQCFPCPGKRRES